MSSKKTQLILMGLALVSALAVPQATSARGGGGGGGGGHAAGMGAFGGGMMGGGRMMGGSPAFGAPFGNAMGGTRVITPTTPFSNFPFFGGGADFFGGFPEASQPFMEDEAPPPMLPPPEPVMGPMNVQVSSPAAQPIATGTHTYFVDGTPTTVGGPIVTEYHWPSAAKKPHHGFARRMR
jgi:hypothetical protein